jgi:DNA-binding response OmpR family regulator
MGSVYRVVSVEDDRGIFDLIRATLKPLPIELHHAQNGQEALKLILKLKPDVVVLDIALPDIHGWDILDRIDELDIEHPEVVVLTARDEIIEWRNSYTQSVNKYMTKPFIPAELRHNVSELLGLA